MKKSYWIAGVLVVGLGAALSAWQMRIRVGLMGGAAWDQWARSALRCWTPPIKTAMVTQAEMDAHKTAEFNKADSNGDGLLSADEMVAPCQQ